jgi:CRISPR/Cas system-associated exonuclease Cas4 (RecB family)
MSSDDIWLTYSSYSQYKTCPKQYDYDRVTQKEPPTRSSQHNAIVGHVLQSVFEDFYNDTLYKEDDVLQTLKDRASGHFQTFMEEKYVDFNDVTSPYDSKGEPWNEIMNTIPKVLQGIKRESLLGPVARSEVEIEEDHGENTLYGYIDFIIKKPDGSVYLIDGKSSKHREENVDVEQLFFYNILFYKKYGHMPDRSGFFYYRFADDPEKAFDWVTVDKQAMDETVSSINEVFEGIRSCDFEATPKAKWCQWCPWNSICDARLEQKKKNRAKRKMNSSKTVVEVDSEDEENGIGFDILEV